MEESNRSSESPNPSAISGPDESTAAQILGHVGLLLGFTIDRIQPSDRDTEDTRSFDRLIQVAHQEGIQLKEFNGLEADEVVSFVRDGFPVIFAEANDSWVVLDGKSGRKVNATRFGRDPGPTVLRNRGIRKMLQSDPTPRIFVAKKEFECDSISASPAHHDSHEHHEHPSPLKRFLGLLQLDRRDITTVILFAFVAGVLALATPLAIESLVNVVSWGTYLQPLLVLALMLLTCLGLAGFLRVLQVVVVEIIQRRQFVRVVSDLAHRFPRANQSSLRGVFPRELANRIFDIMTIQKATAVLLLDGVSIVLTTIVGLVLLAFYHPFLLGFDIVLVATMISITWILGRGGIRTAIDESITKYRVAHWLQDVFAFPSIFKVNGGESLAIQRANQLTADYIYARQLQFRVVIRQVIFAIGLQVVASTVLLGLGGYLVIQGQLTLGQLVASELVVTVVVGAFAKAGKALEKYYDLMAGIDKVGHLLDVSVDPRDELGQIPDGPATISWDELTFRRGVGHTKIPATEIQAGTTLAIVGDDAAGKRLLAQGIAGLVKPDAGIAEVGGYDAMQAGSEGHGRLVAYAGGMDVFAGTLLENVDLGRTGVGPNRVRETLQSVLLWDSVLKLSNGLDTRLQTGGYPLSDQDIRLLVLARAVAARPSVLVVDGLLDALCDWHRETLWDFLAEPNQPWTLIVVTNRDDIASRCDSQLTVR